MRESYKTWIDKIVAELNAKDVYFAFFNLPIAQHRLFISDINPQGNAWGKICIAGKTYREIFEKLCKVDFSNEAMAKMKMSEIPTV